MKVKNFDVFLISILVVQSHFYLKAVLFYQVSAPEYNQGPYRQLGGKRV